MGIATFSSQSLVGQVCDRLAEWIRNHPGESESSIPPERRLSEVFGVSRSVVREAIKRLELQGLLEVRHGSGIRIVDKLHLPLIGSLSLLIPDAGERFRQLQETRLAIEPEAARLAASNATRGQVDTLGEIQERLKSAQDDVAAIEADLEFHRAVAAASGNLMFRLILDSLAEIGMQSRRRTIVKMGMESAIRDHAEIIGAIGGRDAKTAAKVMRRHVLATSRDLGMETTEL